MDEINDDAAKGLEDDEEAAVGDPDLLDDADDEEVPADEFGADAAV